MSEKNKLWTIQISDDHHEKLVLIKNRYGVPLAETARRALDEYLQRRGWSETVENEETDKK